MQEALTQALGLPVRISGSLRKGRVSIAFASPEELAAFEAAQLTRQKPWNTTNNVPSLLATTMKTFTQYVGDTKGDEIITMGGMAGRIADIGENFALVEVADGMKVKIRRTAVESVLPKGTLQEL